MTNEIKEILDDLRKTADNTIFVVCSSQEELDKMPRYTANFLSINDRKAKILLDYITNLQEIAEEHKNCTRKHWQQKCAEHYANEMIYKSRNEKAIEYLANCDWNCKDFENLYDILGGDDNE